MVLCLHINMEKPSRYICNLLIPSPMKTESDTPFVHFLLQDGLLIATLKKGLKVNLAIARQIVQSRLDFMEFKPVLTLILSEGQVTMDKKARDFLASPEGTRGLIAAAMVPRNPFDWAVGSIFLHIRKPAMPTRIFAHYESAIKWLRKFVNEKR